MTHRIGHKAIKSDYQSHAERFYKVDSVIEVMTEKESNCNEKPNHEQPDVISLLLLAALILFVARYIVYPYVVVPYVIPYINLGSILIRPHESHKGHRRSLSPGDQPKEGKKVRVGQRAGQ